MCIQFAKICLLQSASCFIYSSEFYVISEKTLCTKSFTNTFGRQYCMEKNVTMISTNLLLQISYKIVFISFFVLSQDPKTRIKFSVSCGWSSNKNYSYIFFSHSLLQSHVKFNRLLLLYLNFLPCCSCFCYSSILQIVPYYRAVLMKASSQSS